MAGKRRRAPNSLAGHRAEAPLRLLPAGKKPPACPKSAAGNPLLLSTRRVWARFWKSAISSHVDRDSEMYRAERWIRHVDELTRSLTAWEALRFVAGSQGQVRTNPIWRAIVDLEHLIAADEEQLGMTPLARVRQGLTAAAAGDAAARLNQRMRELDKPPAPKDVTPRDVPEGQWEAL